MNHIVKHRKKRVTSVLILLLIMQMASAQSVLEAFEQRRVDSSERRSIPTSPVVPKGSLAVHVLTDQWICVVGDYYDFFLERLQQESGPFLSRLDTGEVSVPSWSYDFHYKFAVWDLIGDYRPKIRDNFQRAGYFSVSRGPQKQQLPIDFSHYWIEAVGQMRVPRIAAEGLQDAHSAQTAHYAYLHLQEPMASGQEYELSTEAGETVSFTYDDRTTLSWAIKVNQEGYVPDAGKKYGYLGMWLGDGGPMDLSEMEGRPFSVIDEHTGAAVLTGTVTSRDAQETHHTKEGLEIPIDGEDVYELDFSALQEEGSYHLYIPGVGISWSFTIGYDAIGYAFYTHARGLYHQRSGIEKGPPYTAWTMGAGHTETYEGGFAPNDRHYRAKSDRYGFYDETGEPVTYSSFSMVRETATDNLLPDVWGGWYDAGDFDRRMYHFDIVEDLLSAYLMYPEKFLDGQLQIPESGNGVPDIIDEAAWGIDIWLRAQSDDGGVGCWIEADSHPQEYDPAEDTQRYYLALPTRESSLTYAVHAALLALAYRQSGHDELAVPYIRSAEAAYSYAVDPGNTADLTFTHISRDGSESEYRYREPAELEASVRFQASALLYLVTQSKGYLPYTDSESFSQALKAITSAEEVYSLLPVFLFADRFPQAYSSSYSERVIELADRLLKSQQELAYRTINWPVDHGFFQFMAWGRGLPYYKGRALQAALRMTGDAVYRDAALLLVDWMNGANPQGRSLTTSIGEVYAVRILSLPSIADGILDPIPGITVYTYNGAIDYQAKHVVYAMDVDGRSDHGFSGFNVSMLPDSLTGGVRELSYKQTGAILEEVIPIYRRYANVEHLVVGQNEFTVWETIGPAASFTACLLPEGWMPPEHWAMRQPAQELSQLHGYLPQP